MTNAPIRLQDLRRSLYVKAKAEPNWRFWGLYVHVCKRETLYEAYRMAKENGGAPENFVFAEIRSNHLGEDQAEPVSPDAEWPERLA